MILTAAVSLASAPAGAEFLVCSGVDAVLPIDTITQEADDNAGTTVSWLFDGTYTYTLESAGSAVVGYSTVDDEEVCPVEEDTLGCAFIAQTTGSVPEGTKAQCMNGDVCTYKDPTGGHAGTGPAWQCEDVNGGRHWVYGDLPTGCGVVKGGTGELPGGGGWMNGQFCPI